MAMTDFTIVRRSLTSRFFSTVVTVLMVATAVGLMLVLLSMRDAGRKAFERGSGNMHMLVSRDASPLVAVLNGVFYANPPRNPIPWSKYREIADGFPLEYAIPIQQGDSFAGFPVLATTPEFFAKYQPNFGEPWAFAAGGPIEDSFDVVIGAAVAKGLASTTPLKLGDRLHLRHGISESRAPTLAGGSPEPDNHDDEHGDDEHGDDEAALEDDGHVHDEFDHRLVGILEPTGGPHDRAVFTHLDSAWIIHAHDRRVREQGTVGETSQDDLTDADRLITGMYLRVLTRQGAAVSGAQQQVFDMLRRDTSITVADPVQEINNLFRIVSNIDQIFIGIAAVVMVSSGIAIMLALYNSMAQRRRQIAVLRVLGASRARVFGLIVTESAILGIVGAVAGIVAAYFAGDLVAAIMKARLGLVIDPYLPWVESFAVGVATIVLASAAGLIPALMAYRTAVVRNLQPLG